MQFYKKDFDFIPQVFGQERESPRDPLCKLSTVWKNANQESLKSVWEYWGSCSGNLGASARYGFDWMSYWRRRLPEHLHILNSSHQPACSLCEKHHMIKTDDQNVLTTLLNFNHTGWGTQHSRVSLQLINQFQWIFIYITSVHIRTCVKH